MRPVFHLSIPVVDLDESVAFYADHLGADIGRRADTFADALVFGAQVTLQDDAPGVSRPMPRTRHFGATLPWDQWETLAAHLVDTVVVVEPPTISYEGQPIEQGKLMIADPSGNLIELKAYRHPGAVLGPLVS